MVLPRLRIGRCSGKKPRTPPLILWKRAFLPPTLRSRHRRPSSLHQGRHALMTTPLTLTLYVNNQLTTVTVADGTEPLLYVLRNQVGTMGVKFGCGVAQCGACTVITDGVTKRSCVTPLNTVADGAQVTTLEGLDTLVGHRDDDVDTGPGNSRTG